LESIYCVGLKEQPLSFQQGHYLLEIVKNRLH